MLEAPERPSPTPPADLDVKVPRLAAGTRLLGPYQDAAYASPRYLIGRGDGRMLLVTPIVYAVAERIDGRRTLGTIAEEITRLAGRRLEVESLDTLLESKLAPLGVLDDGAVTAAESAQLLGLGLRFTLVPAVLVNALGRALSFLFHPFVMVLTLSFFVLVDGMFFHRVALGSSLAAVLVSPTRVLQFFGLMLVGMLFHELGHASGCRYGGGRPGRIGMGVYLLVPAFFTNVSDAYRLRRADRLRTDLGGVYFNTVFVVVVGIFELHAHDPVLATTLVLIQIGMLQQLLPLVRLDGYFVLGDLIGVPDLFARIGPALRRRKAERSPVGDLRRGAAIAVWCWIGAVVPSLLALGVVFAWRAPVFWHVSWQALSAQSEALVAAARAHALTHVALSAISIALVALPVAGITLFVLRSLALAAKHARRRLVAGTSRRRDVSLTPGGAGA